MSSQRSSFGRFWSGLSAEHQSAVLLVSGISILGLSDNFVPYVSDEIGLGQFHFMRSAMALICVLGLAMLGSQSLRPIRWPAVMLRTVLLTASMALYFAVLSFLPVAIAGAGLFTSPIFVLLFSVLLFGLKPGWRRILAVLTGSAGMWLVLRPDSLGFHPLQFLPVLAGALYALSSITTKRLCSEESALALVAVYFAVLGGAGLVWAVAAPAFISGPVPPEADFIVKGLVWADMLVWFWVGLMAVLTVLSIWMLARAYQIAETSYAVIYEYSYLISAGVVGVWLWQAQFSLSSLGGMALIVLSGLIITLATRQRSSDK